jgi:hypothetical protein
VAVVAAHPLGVVEEAEAALAAWEMKAAAGLRPRKREFFIKIPLFIYLQWYEEHCH